jgi:hypothetical protein
MENFDAAGQRLSFFGLGGRIFTCNFLTSFLGGFSNLVETLPMDNLLS